MKKILEQLLEHQKLSRAEAHDALSQVAKNQCNEAQIAAFMTVFLMRSIAVEELAGFCDALLELCLRVDFDGVPTLDLCGTGGDAKNTFNISTLASFVAAGAGAKVVKHGNYGVSSVCGSSNVMERIGYVFKNDPDALRRELEQAGICFLHAPLFHPALKNVAPVRRALGIKTFFNMLGPLVNPARPAAQLTGVFNLELGRIYRYLLQDSDKKFAIVHTQGGYDELSLTAQAACFSHTGEFVLSPDQFGGAVSESSIFGGETVDKAVKIFVDVLENRGTTAQNRVVVANAALALQCAGTAKNLEEGIASATESLHSGRAMQVLQALIHLN